MAYVDNGDDELDYEDEDYAELDQPYTPGAIGALAGADMPGEEEEEEEDYEDLYDGVDVGFFGNSTGAGGEAEDGGQNGGEGYGDEEEYAEEYEGEGRSARVGEEEDGYAEEEYREVGEEEELGETGTDVRPKTEGDYDPEVEEYGEEETNMAVEEEDGVEVKEEEVEEVEEVESEEDILVGDGDVPVVAAAPGQADGVGPNVAARSKPVPAKVEGMEESSRPATSPGPAPSAVKSEEKDYMDEDSQVRRGAGAGGVAGVKPKVEVESGATSSQQGGKTVADRVARGGAALVNGSAPASSEGGGVARAGGGGALAWPAGSTRGGSAGPTSNATTPAAASPAVANREVVAGGGIDYSAKHGASHQHEAGGIMLFVGELHWWTTDAELEAALSEYGRVKNLKFFEEKASGRSKGYCQVEFYEAGAARACKEKMDGRVFNDRSCVVAFASPQTIKQMGAAQVGKNQVQGHNSAGGPGRGRGESGPGGRGGPGGSQMGDGGRGYGRDKMPMGGRNGGPGERGRGSGRGRVGNLGGRGGGGGGAHFQGPPGPMGGGPGMMPPQGMMGGGFDPAFGPPMGGRGGYGMGPVGPGGGFGPRGPFVGPGMGPPFPAMGPGLPGVAPHVNPAFFGRANGNGPGIGMDGPAGGWGDGPMPGWGGDEQERRMMYGDDMGGPDYGYPGDMGPDRLRPGPARERDRGVEGDWPGVDRRRREERGEGEWAGERHRDRGARDEYWEREQGREKEKDWPERERLPRGREKARVAAPEDEERPRSRDEDFGKRRRMVADRKIER